MYKKCASGAGRGGRRPRLRSCLYPCSAQASRSAAGGAARARAGRASRRACVSAGMRAARRYSDMEALGGGRSSEDERAAPRRATGRLVESTQAEDRRLIALVGARPLLYARSTLPVASYYSQVKKLWQEVADLMGWTVAEVRRKWSHIRNSYSRHLRNETHGLRTGRGRMVSRWYLADELEFLRHHMATDTRPSPSSYSMVSVSPFAPSLLQMEVSSADEESAGGAWYSAPEPAPRDAAGAGAPGFEPHETDDYFHFFRGLYRDYRDLPPPAQRRFRRKCVVLLHELLDGAGDGGEEAGAAGADDSDGERDQKCFVQALPINGADTAGEPADTAGEPADT